MPDTAAAPSEIHKFPCETCGSDLRFQPGTDRLVCDHCGNVEEITGSPWTRAAAVQEIDIRAGIDRSLADEDMEESRVVTCKNCGATVEFDPNLHAAECPFCATPVVTDTGSNRHIKPKALLPFALDEDAARAAMTDWLGSLWFAPNGLQDYARKGRKMSGVYMPYWTFDADTRSTYRGERGTEYQTRRQVMRNGKRETVTVTKVRWRAASGRVARFFDDVLVAASAALPDRFRPALGQWDLAELEAYQPVYLAGFRAEAYSVELEAAFVRAREIMDRVILGDVKRDIGGDRQRVHHIDTMVSDVTFKHILLPVWIAAYRYRGKAYRFAVNGRTGAVSGERPWSAIKIAIAVIFGLLVAGAVGYFAAQNQG
ncbi:MAG: TFIIB-type zinc finger domain-containing protein [Paracoccaceae bacterium]|nr:TFIIB-type zinc finger domain-containing protein [Paracoccaceae bacterium]